jgi:hypothetical protein
MPVRDSKLGGRLVVLICLVVLGAAALVLFARYGLHRLAARRRSRG